MRSVERSAYISGSSCGADRDDGVQVGPVVPEEIRQLRQQVIEKKARNRE